MDGGIPSFQRPSSDKDVDIHVLIVPASLWRADLRFAYSSTCLESVSSGFVRVYPSTPLCALRKEIARQLDLHLLPDGYVFLRNVGRHLTWVTAKQESKLKAKLFVPPLAPCPELYILDARCLKDWLPLGETSSQHSQKKGGYLRNNSYSYHPPLTEVQSRGQTTEGLAGTYLSIHSHQHPVAATQLPVAASQLPVAASQHHPLRAHHSNLGSHPLHAQAPHYNQNFTAHPNQLPHSSQESPHHSHTNTYGQTAKHAALSKNPNANGAVAVHQRRNSRHTLPHSSQESPHHNHTNTHGQTAKHAALSKNPNANGAATVYQRRNSRHTLPHSSQESPHHNHTNTYGQTAKHVTLSKNPNANGAATVHQRQNSRCILPYSSQESPHHNHTSTHGQTTKHATLSKNPNTDGAAAVHQRRNSRRTSLQAPQSTVAGPGTGHHSTPAMAGGSYKLLHQEEVHRRDRGSLRNCTTNPRNPPSKMTIACPEASSLKHPPTNSHERIVEATMPTTSQVNLVRTGTDNGANESLSESSSESSEGEVPYRHGFHDRVSPNHPMVAQATDAIEKAVYGDYGGKNGVGIVTKQRVQGTGHHGTGGGGDRREPAAEHQVRNEPLQQTDHWAFSSSRVQSPAQNTTEIHRKLAGNGQDKTAHVTFNIPAQNTRDDHSDPRNAKRLRGVGGLRVQSSGREKVKGVRTMTETHSPKKTSRKESDGKEFEHTRSVNGKSNSIPLGMSAHHDHSTDLYSSLPVATDKTSTLPFKIPSERADFSLNVPLPPINERTTKSSSVHLPASNSIPTSEVNDLLARIRIAKQECGHLQQTKANLGTNFRNLQLLLKTRREDADKEWKRRFFQEKKATTSLEDRIKETKGDIQALQVKLDRQRESHMKDLIHGTAPLTETPSQHSNIKIQCRRLELSIQELKQTLLTTRQRLAAEQEAHKAVLGECRALRRECMGKKIACTRTRGHPVIQHS